MYMSCRSYTLCRIRGRALRVSSFIRKEENTHTHTHTHAHTHTRVIRSSLLITHDDTLI